jgi:riboflavin biosynthesis pyrimidine reductase
MESAAVWGSAIDHQAFHVMRSLADVIVVGAGTARAEGYGPVQASEILPGASIPPIAVVTRSLDVPDRLVAPGQIVITSRSSDPQRRAELAATVDVIAAGDDDIDWHVVLDTLTERGLRKVLCEGGPNLHGTLIELDLVDEFCLTIAPVALAGGAPRIAHSHLASARSLELTHAVHDDGTILTRWTRKKD